MRLTSCPRCKNTVPDDMNCYWCNFPDAKKKKGKVKNILNTPLFNDDDPFFD